MKQFFSTTLGFWLIIGALPAAIVDPLQWNLSTLTFQATSFPSGAVSTGTVTGSFTYDADKSSFPTWSFELSGFPGTGIPDAGLLLTPANTVQGDCFAPSCPPGSFAVYATPPGPLFNFSALSLTFTDPLTDAGGSALVDGTSGTVLILDLPIYNSFFLQPPGGTASAVPEPAYGALVLLPALGFGLFGLRRRNASRAGPQASSTATGTLPGT